MRTQYLLKAELLKDKVSSFKEFPFHLPAVRYLDNLEFHPHVTFIVGENGSGKSTLLEAIAISWGFNAEGGSKNFNFSTQSTHSDLYKCLRLSKGTSHAKDGYFLRAESFYNVASEVKKLGVGDSYGDKALHDQSHGESFMSLVLNRFSGNGLYILDEPEAALSPSRQLALISRIHDLVSQNSQFIIATHSPILMAYPDSCIFVLEESGIKNIDYTKTEHYQVTKEFINNYPKMLKILMAD
ncbi:MAG: AAA family ATPase [Candidatus Omnitrophota bacterium]